MFGVCAVQFLTATRLRFMSLEVSCGLLLYLISQLVDFEAIQTRYKLVGWALRSVLWMNHEQHVWKPCTEVSTVCMVVSRGFRSIDVHALGAV